MRYTILTCEDVEVTTYADDGLLVVVEAEINGNLTARLMMTVEDVKELMRALSMVIADIDGEEVEAAS